MPAEPTPSQQPDYPCRRLPDIAGHQKLLGLYQQAQDERWLQRICIPGGRLTAEQWRVLASIAQQFTPQTPLHLTTRQDIEIHDLREPQIPDVHEQLHAVGLSCFGAAGDTIRNITVCPCAGTQAGSADLMPLARQLLAAMRSLRGIYDLPRKFKIALMCSPTCGQPYINDLSLIAAGRNSRQGFRVVGAGSLGVRPNTGIELFDFVSAADVLPLVHATVEFFAEHGDRENRTKARLRHVRERMGDEEFLRRLSARYKDVAARREWPIAEAGEEGRFAASRILNFANGDVTPAAARSLAVLCSREDMAVRIANAHQVIVFADKDAAIHEALSAETALMPAAELQRSVVACPGKRWCKRGLVNTNELANRIRDEIDLPPDGSVCISGCPNGCSHPAVAQVGLVGKLKHNDGQRVECFDLRWGGEMGHSNVMGELIETKQTPREVLNAIQERLRGET